MDIIEIKTNLAQGASSQSFNLPKGTFTPTTTSVNIVDLKKGDLVLYYGAIMHVDLDSSISHVCSDTGVQVYRASCTAFIVSKTSVNFHLLKDYDFFQGNNLVNLLKVTNKDVLMDCIN
jgi:hypothetical protein